MFCSTTSPQPLNPLCHLGVGMPPGSGGPAMIGSALPGQVSLLSGSCCPREGVYVLIASWWCPWALWVGLAPCLESRRFFGLREGISSTPGMSLWLLGGGWLLCADWDVLLLSSLQEI